MQKQHTLRRVGKRIFVHNKSLIFILETNRTVHTHTHTHTHTHRALKEYPFVFHRPILIHTRVLLLPLWRRRRVF